MSLVGVQKRTGENMVQYINNRVDVIDYKFTNNLQKFTFLLQMNNFSEDTRLNSPTNHHSLFYYETSQEQNNSSN